jgi:protein arginine N-methyltransferase 2
MSSITILSINDQLMKAAEQGDVDTITMLCNAGAEHYYQEIVHGESVLQKAASHGHLAAVNALLELGAPWNAVDRQGRCAGTVALNAGHQEIVNRIVEAGVESELKFAEIEKKSKKHKRKRQTPAVTKTTSTTSSTFTPNNSSSSSSSSSSNNNNSSNNNAATTASGMSPEGYIKQKLKYVGRGAAKALVDERGAGVMMQWEKPLMEAHAKVLCMFSTQEERGADVLNVGFGMGLIDTAIQNMAAQGHAPRTHTIIEAHPDVYAKMCQDGWDKKPGVRIFHGRWQDVLRERGQELGDFDGVFFDTFDDVDHMRDFMEHLPTLVRPGGIYSFFNGLCPENIIFQGVACQVIKLELEQMPGGGFDTNFYPMKVECQDPSLWEGTPFRYYFRNDYHLPVSRRNIVNKE